MSRTEANNIKLQIEARKLELKDDICARFPTAKMHVQAELDRLEGLLSA